MHGNVAAVSVAVDQRVLRPASLVRANTAAADHLLHVTFRELVVRHQTTLAGDHLRRKRTCGRIEPLQNSRTGQRRRVSFPSVACFRFRLSEMSCFKRVCVPFWQRIFHQNIHFTARRSKRRGRGELRWEPEVRNDAKARVCVRHLTGSVQEMWLDLFESNILLWFPRGQTSLVLSTKQAGFSDRRWAMQQPGRERTWCRRFVIKRQLHCKDRSVCVLVQDEKQMCFYTPEEHALPVMILVRIKVFFSRSLALKALWNVI